MNRGTLAPSDAVAGRNVVTDKDLRHGEMPVRPNGLFLKIVPRT